MKPCLVASWMDSSSDAKTDIDFHYNYGCVDLRRESMTLAGPQAEAAAPRAKGSAGPARGPLVWFRGGPVPYALPVLHDACAPCGVR